jgi:dihydrofolate synthase/folylpolyglutamate synthase
VHIAGTKGKGTTAAMVAGMLEAAGYCVGLFTSPHISFFEERIQVNGSMPRRGELVKLVRRAAEAAEALDQLPGQMAPTFFELTMALGWLWFEAKCVDVAVLEVGLGGRLDATNVCSPLVCAITSISRDHTGLLGSTLPQIAREKAGIIKPGVPVVTGVEDESAHAAIAEVCRGQRAKLLSLDREIRVVIFPTEGDSQADPPTISVLTPGNRYDQIRVPLTGQHQVRNTALAVGLIDQLNQQGWRISESAVLDGLKATRWPLRIEVVNTSPWVILDVAHNWASVRALLETLNRGFPADRRILIFAASRDKDVPGMLRQLIPRFDSLIVTQFLGNPRSTPIEKLQRLVHSLSGRFAHAAGTPAQAWQLARRLAGPRDLICGAGSFFIAGELREVIVGPPGVPPENAKAVNSAVDGLG